jgi:sulfite reductase alpha subunit-like flavoprotein
MMGFMQERDAIAKAAKKGGARLGPALLFFGCRSADEDYIYRDRLEGYLGNGVLTGLHVAFSRDGPSKVYVQVRALWGGQAEWRPQPRPGRGGVLLVIWRPPREAGTARAAPLVQALSPVLRPPLPPPLPSAPPWKQDLIQQQGAMVWELLEAGAVVYICGDARRMAPDVKKAFVGVARDCGGRSEASAQNWMGALLEGGRYLEDVWAG